MMDWLEENHAREQYFFDAPTLDELADFVGSYERPCCLCAPLLGRELHRRGRRVRILDVDDRISDLPGFLQWDLYRPHHIPEVFDLVVCDPPFFNVSLSQLFTAVRVLCHFDVARRIIISYPVRRRHALMSVFSPFGLRPSGYYPQYLTVQRCRRNEIEFYANFDLPLRGARR